MHPYYELIHAHMLEITQPLGITLFSFAVDARGQSMRVRCTADFPQGGITVQHCTDIAVRLRAWLENACACPDAHIEVATPGLDRPLKTLADFTRVMRRPLMLWLKQAHEGKTYIEGVLSELTETTVTIKNNDTEITIPFSTIATGKEKISTKGGSYE